MKDLRKLLWPFAVPYDLITRVRNTLFDNQVFESESYDFPVIGVGNLSVGGTGKTPMIEYLIELLGSSQKLAVLSRGYGRKTTGYLDVAPHLSAADTGDEPLQFAKKYQDVQVAVCEKRRLGIQRLREKTPAPEVILLDDVYQHRHVQPGLLLMLTAYGDLFYEDFVLPAGNLRESRSGAQRADLVVVTKCPFDLAKEQRALIKSRIAQYTKAPVFFSGIAYDLPVGVNGPVSWTKLQTESLNIVTGIAKPQPFLDHLDLMGLTYKHLEFADHHTFNTEEIKALDRKKVILTTEKDFMRLKGKLKKAKLYYLPMRVKFLAEEERFNASIEAFVAKSL